MSEQRIIAILAVIALILSITSLYFSPSFRKWLSETFGQLPPIRNPLAFGLLFLVLGVGTTLAFYDDRRLKKKWEAEFTQVFLPSYSSFSLTRAFYTA
jgi:hypothetical protein